MEGETGKKVSDSYLCGFSVNKRSWQLELYTLQRVVIVERMKFSASAVAKGNDDMDYSSCIR